jgi:hypothetical protein
MNRDVDISVSTVMEASHLLPQEISNMTPDTCYAVYHREHLLRGYCVSPLGAVFFKSPPPCLATDQPPPPHQSSRTPNCSQFVSYYLTLFLTCVISSTLKMEATCSSETSVYNKPTWHHIPEDGVIPSYRHENLKGYRGFLQFEFVSYVLLCLSCSKKSFMPSCHVIT